MPQMPISINLQPIANFAECVAREGGPMLKAVAHRSMEVAHSGFTASRQILNRGAIRTGAVLATATTMAGVGVPLAATAFIKGIGFTVAGVGGSMFASLQSTGALGGVAIFGPVGIGAGAVGLVTAGIIQYRRAGTPLIPVVVVDSHIYEHGYWLASDL